ncbi:MAG: LysR family transcriptional regulator [Myxococcales bacterium]|nr:LysR family transcriptional regulator [Myxococcales bacterium]
MLPSLESLRCFEAAARTLRFREAARAVALTPTAFGQRIQKLEEDLGVALFARTTRRVQLTREGLALLPLARRCLLAAEACADVTSHDSAATSMDLTLGTRHDPPEVFPQHLDASRLEAAARNLISISCMAETVAVALIGAERDAMPDGPLRELLTTIWADEVGHARFGWRALDRIVPELAEGERDRLDRYLRVAFAHLERHELAHLPLGSVRRPGGDELGLCSGAEARELFYATVERAIVPGLERLGLGARAAWEKRREPPSPGPRRVGERAPVGEAGSAELRVRSSPP